MLLISLKIFKNTRDVHQRSSLTLEITFINIHISIVTLNINTFVYIIITFLYGMCY